MDSCLRTAAAATYPPGFSLFGAALGRGNTARSEVASQAQQVLCNISG